MIMFTMKKNISCRPFRNWLYSSMSRYIGPDAKWLQNHISNCPNCRKRLASYTKVDLALSIMKSQPHRLDLLMRANTQAIGVLKHSLRNEPKAEKLKVIQPEPKFPIRWSKCVFSAVNVAACIMIVLLMKMGIFSSMNTVQTQGQKAMRHYYASRAGEDIANQIFPDASQNPPSVNQGNVTSA